MTKHDDDIELRAAGEAKALLYQHYRHMFKDHESLVVLDLAKGRPTGANSLLVPAPIARALNELRATLTSESPAEAYHCAAAPLPWRLLDVQTRRRVHAIERLQDPKLVVQESQAEREPEPATDQADDLPEAVGKVTVASMKRAEELAAASATAHAAGAPEVALMNVNAFGCHEVVVHKKGAFDARIALLGRLAGSIKSSTEGQIREDLEKLSRRGASRMVMLPVDWRLALKALADEMPNFSAVVDSVAQQCLLAQETDAPLRLHPIMLVGPPGVGKTHFARCLATALKVPMFNYPMESAETTSTLTGSDKHWANSQPGALFDLIIRGDIANPLVILDEIDKAPAGTRGHYQPRSALYPLLEPSTAEAVRDKSADIEFNASHVIYVATANALSSIEPPMLSRFELHLIHELTAPQAVSVARHIHRRVVQERSLFDFYKPGPGVIQELALIGNPRQIHRLVVRAIARAIERGGQDDNRLQVDDLGLDSVGRRQPLH